MRSIFETGFLKPKKGDDRGRKVKYYITLIEEKHLPMVMDLQRDIANNLERPDMLQTFSQEFMKQHMGTQGLVFGVFVQDRLVAFRNLYYPDPWDREWNLGHDLGLSDGALADVVNLQMVCVHPSFRGNALAFKMNQCALKLLRQLNTHLHVCATVSPYNIWNIPILLKSGFSIAALKLKYGGMVRYIAYQNIGNPMVFDDNDTVTVNLNDLDTQKKLLDSNFYGVSLLHSGGKYEGGSISGFNIVFKRACQERMADSPHVTDAVMLAALSQNRKPLSPTSSWTQ